MARFPDQLRQTPRPEHRMVQMKRLSLSQHLVSNRRPITLPAGNYAFDGGEYVLFSNRNAYRIPDYYRVDASLNYDYKKKSNQRIGFAWSISVYNIFGRNNPFRSFLWLKTGRLRADKVPSLTCLFLL